MNTPRIQARRPRGILKRSATSSGELHANNNVHSLSPLPRQSNGNDRVGRQTIRPVATLYEPPIQSTGNKYQHLTTSCRQMIFDITTLSGLLVRENHHVTLAIEGYSLALNITHLQSRISECQGNTFRHVFEELVSELAWYMHQKDNLMASMHNARISFWGHQQEDLSGYVYMDISDDSSDHNVIMLSVLDMHTDANWISSILYNMSLAYSALHSDTAALQSYQLAYECLSFISDAYKGAVMRLRILRRMDEIVGALAECNEEAAGIAQQIRDELLKTEVALLSGCPCAASAA